MKKSTKKILIIGIAVLLLVAAGVTAWLLLQDKDEAIVDDRTVLLSETELTLVQGSSYTLSARLSLGKGEFVWSSSDESVATVTQDGIVNCVGIGNVVITASYGDKSASCTITVILPDYFPVFSQPDQTLSIVVGQSYPIDHTVTFNGETVTAEMAYESEDPAIATVSADGYVTGVAEGETYVDVTANYKGLVTTMRAKIVVNANIVIQSDSSQVRLDTLPVPSLGLVDVKNLTLQVLKEGEDVTGTLSYTWTVDDDSIIAYTSSENSMEVAVKKAGTTVITATFELDGKTYDYRYHVNVVTTKLTVEPEEGYLTVDLSGVEGNINSVSLDGNNGSKYLTNQQLRIYKTALTAGEHPAEVKTSQRIYAFILDVDKEVVALRDETKTAQNNAYTVDMSYANIDWSEVLEFNVNNKDGNSLRKDNILSLKQSNTAYGNYKVDIITKGRIDYQFNLFCYTDKLSSSNVTSASTLLMFLQGAPNADFTLESDIDLCGEKFAGYVADFSGTLDGKGHVIKNFKIGSTTLFGSEGSDLTAGYLILNNTGVIKNVGFIYELIEVRDCNLTSLIGKNNGTVENCFANMHFTATHKSWNIAPLVNSNEGVGVVRNCVTVITKNTAAITTTRFGAVVAAAIGNSTTANCYGIYNDVLGSADQKYPHIADGITSTATVRGCSNYATSTQFFGAVKSFPEADGWSSYWKHAGDVVFFGNTPIASIIIPAQTVELTDGVYNVNLSAVSRTISGVSIDGKEYQSYLSGKTLSIPQSEITMGTHAVTISTTSGVQYTMELTCLIPGQSLENYVTLTFREGGTNRLIYINEQAPTLNVDFFVTEDLEGVAMGTVLVGNAKVYINGKLHTATLTYQKENNDPTRKGYIQLAVVAPTGWTPTKGNDNYASDPAVTLDLLIPEGIELGSTGKMTTATRYLLSKTTGLETGTAHPRKAITAEIANPADYVYSTEVDTTVTILGVRYADLTYINETTPRFVLNYYLDAALQDAANTGENVFAVASGATIYINGVAHSVDMNYVQDAAYLQVIVFNPYGWTPTKGTDNYASDPAITLDVLVPAGIQFSDGKTLEEAARHIFVKKTGLDTSGAHPKQVLDIPSEASDPAEYEYITEEEEPEAPLSFRDGGTNRLIYISEQTPTLNVDFFLTEDLTGVTAGTVINSNATVYINGVAHTATITYQKETVGEMKGYIQLAVSNPKGWTPTKGTDNYASDPAVVLDLLIPAETLLNGQELGTAMRYLLSKPVGLDTGTAHPRKAITAEEADPAEYEFATEASYVNITGYRYGRAIFVSKATPRLDLEFFTDVDLANTSGSTAVPYPVATGVTIYINGVAHQVNIGYNATTKVVAFSVENPVGWTPTEGGNSYATDPAVTFDILIPAGIEFSDGQILEQSVRYILTKSEGLVQTDVHPRKEMTAEVADPAEYVFATSLNRASFTETAAVARRIERFVK